MVRRPAPREKTPGAETARKASAKVEAEKSTTDLEALRARQEQDRLRARLKTKFH